jgi:pimeloyl-ACP methyl ester carboxylesterase
VDEFLAAHPRRTVAAAGAWWECLSGGAGPEVVLVLPGGLGLPELGFGQILDLERDYRVLSPAYPPSARMRDLVDGIAALLRAEGVESAHVIGASFGGQVAQCLVRRHPSLVRSLVLSHTGVPTPARARRMRRALRLFGVLPFWAVRWMLRRRLKGIFSGAAGSESWRRLLDGLLQRVHRTHLVGLYACGIDFDENHGFAPGDLAGWSGRVLVLGSDDDPIYPAEERRRLEALYPGAQVHTFHGTGHISSLLEPDEYRAQIGAFLRGA